MYSSPVRVAIYTFFVDFVTRLISATYNHTCNITLTYVIVYHTMINGNYVVKIVTHRHTETEKLCRNKPLILYS